MSYATDRSNVALAPDVLPEQRFTEHSSPTPVRVPVVSFRVTLTDQQSVVEQVIAWTTERVGRYVCAANVHMVMEAFDSRTFKQIVDAADLVVPDGMPLVWAQRLFGHREAARVPGPELTEALLARAAALGIPIGLYGGTERSLKKFTLALSAKWPTLRIAVAIAPPFRPLTAEEDELYVAQVIASGARILFVGIGCPKQEKWMAEHVDRIPCVMLGVGQAFDILSGVKRDAPRWMHGLALGWFYRLCHEPRRLWRRYAVHNPRFIGLLFAQWIRYRLYLSRRGKLVS